MKVSRLRSHAKKGLTSFRLITVSFELAMTVLPVHDAIRPDP